MIDEVWSERIRVMGQLVLEGPAGQELLKIDGPKGKVYLGDALDGKVIYAGTQLGLATAVPGPTEQGLLAIPIPAGTFRRYMGIRYLFLLEGAANVNSKRARLRVGGTPGSPASGAEVSTQTTTSSTNQIVFRGEIFATTVPGRVSGEMGSLLTFGSSFVFGNRVSDLDLDAEILLTATGQATAADRDLVLEAAYVELLPKVLPR